MNVDNCRYDQFRMTKFQLLKIWIPWNNNNQNNDDNDDDDDDVDDDDDGDSDDDDDDEKDVNTWPTGFHVHFPCSFTFCIYVRGE